MLDKHEEIEFVNFLTLPRSKRVPIGYNFECLICKEGKSHGRKRRAYLLINSPKHPNVRYFCQNCNVSMSLKEFLKDYNPSLFEEYRNKEKQKWLEDFRTGQKKQKEGSLQIHETQPEYIQLKTRYFQPANENVKAIQYCQKRKISQSIIERLYYVPENLKIDRQNEEQIRPLLGMVVFPFRDSKGIYGYQGRSLEGKRFHTYSTPGHKYFMGDNLRFNSTVYIFESIIDSLFVDNSIAMLGSSLTPTLHNLLKDRVYCLDNDVSDDIVRKMEKLIESGEKVVIWPYTLEETDINDMVLSGMDKKTIINIINENTYQGFEARTRLGFLELRKKRT